MWKPLTFIFSSIIGTSIERLKVRLPYPAFLMGITFLAAIPTLSLFLSLARIPNWAFIVFFSSLVGAAIIGAMFSFLGFIGYLSGYRDFMQSWPHQDQTQLRQKAQTLKEALQQKGYEVVWEDERINELVALKNLALEYQVVLVGTGERFPMRVALLNRSKDAVMFEATLFVQSRWLVFFDSGEKAACYREGEELAQLLESL